MNLLDNIDKQLEEIQRVKESQEAFKHTKVKVLIKKKETRKGYFENKQKNKSDKKFSRKIKKLRLKTPKRKYRRCPKKYNAYIKSHWWTERKNRYYQSYPKLCVVCRSSKYITLHHMVYGELGNEKDEHLIPLCKKHHEGYHIEYGVRGNMLETTLEYVLKEQRNY